VRADTELVETMNTCPMQKKYGETICKDGTLWSLTYSDCAPPDQRQAMGDCPHCAKQSGVEIISKHTTQIGPVEVNFTVGRISRRK
jgi:hypothetical protein